MAGQFDFNAAFVTSSVVMPIPVQRPWSQLRPGGKPQRSNSASRAADYHHLGARRALGHARTSSGTQPTRSSHDTSLQTDRPAAAAIAVAAVAPGHAQADAQGAESVAPIALSPAFKPPSAMYRARLGDDGRPLDSSVVAPMLSRLFRGPGEPPRSSYPCPQINAHAASAESVSSASAITSLSARTTMTTDPFASASASRDSHLAARPFVLRNGRTYHSDPTLPYPLPVDLGELHRQSLRTLLLIQLFGAPVCSPSLANNPPRRVLDVGCGAGFWSIMCHRYYKSRGHGNISFTGIDVTSLCSAGANSGVDAAKPDKDMKWRFVSHDVRNTPWPLPDAEFDLIMVKDMSLAIVSRKQEQIFNEYLRLLKPGGILEIWESDHLIRMLRPHVPGAAATGDDDEREAASNLGAYILSANTPLSAPLNSFLIDYNTWLTRALESRHLSPVPCTLIGPALLQESETLVDVRCRRLAIPLSEVRWEREGIHNPVACDVESDSTAKSKEMSSFRAEQRTLTAGQSALRATALLTVVQQVQALEPILREVSGKSQDEWDVWLGKMMGDLMGEGGAGWGECLEVGAWWARKRGE
ncbi:hypothetical protein HIM_03588 [Hirsutella minnesotensis 3608]|uniref:Methyltransferase domain-containing protein n=1 Tax=Hirsutella minnesotensis 3608 TaxID=1043627 RepID=A0A0F8A2T7_9HYPO|nr:hypothetical protein HIM_03588 [Hirsutella minnesotensis 3608]